MRTVIFDLDGTLADTSGDLIAAANACLAERGQGHPLDPDRDRATAFRGGRALLRLGFERGGAAAPPAVADETYARFLEIYGADLDSRTVLYPGLLAAMDGLAASGARLGVCTNKPAGLSETLLARLGIRDRFAALVGADTLPVRKPDPEPYRLAVERAGGALGRSLMVGDTETDRETARAAGVACVLVGFGPEGETLARFGPEALLPHYDELAGIVDRLVV